MTTKNLYERKVSFIDAKKERVNLEIEIRDINKERYPYGELSICSQSWQWKFIPDWEAQQKLLDIWNTYHLNGMSAGTDKQNDILKACNAPDTYIERCNELRNYDFNWNFMLDMNKRKLAQVNEELYNDYQKLIWIVKTLINKKTYKWDPKYYDLLMKVIEEDRISFTTYNYIRWVHNKWITKKYCYEDCIINFAFPQTNLSKQITQQILDSIQERIDNFPVDNLSAIFDMDRGKLIRYGCTWVIKDLPEDLSKTIEDICNEIEDEMKENTLVSDIEYEEFVKLYPNFDNPEKVYALACNREWYLDSLEYIDENSDTEFKFEWDYWLVCTDDEANETHLEYIKQLFDEIGFDWFNQNCVKTNIELDLDWNVVITKSISIPENERGNSLNHYDGYQHDTTVNGTTYYIYQQ